MSTRDRLSRLTADLVNPPSVEPALAAVPVPTEPPLPPAPGGSAQTFPPIGARPAGSRTAPGQRLAFRGHMLAAEGEVQTLRRQLEQHAGSTPAKTIDPKLVRPSAWADRHEASYTTPEFIRFKEEIEHAGGNVQPILVKQDGEQYELVFGHRRHRACLESGLPVLALLAEGLSDLEVFTLMDRENREREDLSAWEQGTMYRRALEAGLFPSQRRLAESVGVSHTWVRRAIAVAELPEPIVQCFKSPLELTVRYAEEVGSALETDRKGVLRRAEKLRQSDRMSSSAVVAALVGKQRNQSESRELKIGNKIAARLVWDKHGRAAIRFESGVLTAESAELVLKAITKAIGPDDAGS